MSRLFFSSLLGLAWLVVASGAAASPKVDRDAARQFAEGTRAFKAGDYRRAGESFEAAYATKPHHAPLWNGARSWHRAGELVHAANLYEQYLREAPADAPDRDNATAALREVSQRTGRVELHAATGVRRPRIDGTEVRVPVLHVAPGEHVAEGDTDGAPLRKTFDVEAGARVSVTLSPAPPALAEVPPLRPLPAPPEPSSGLPPIVVLAGGVLTVAGGALTVWSGLDTVSQRDAFLGDPTQSRLDDAFSSQTRTNVLLGTTLGVAALTGVVAIFFTDWRGAQATSRVGAR
ncbi:MAG: hypothetical protein KC657_09765 [Myxococcales bacterium]|nr:hypothetical protein [Myxococcales bacterium]